MMNPPFLVTVSVVMKGEQMVPVLNSLGIQCAVYGNHDFGKVFCVCVFSQCDLFCQDLHVIIKFGHYYYSY